MGLMEPTLNDPIDRFVDIVGEDQVFTLDNIRVLSVTTREYGTGEMVVMKVREHKNELGIWGAYLLAQAKAVKPDDLGKQYKIVRKLVPGFSSRPVKAFEFVA